ncbi:hypothetical protein N9N16_02120 [Porticoccaceae bacterium]|nr:hypothetical protein [Porticoccaceae bacterium]
MKSLTNSLRSKAHFPAIKVKLILICAMACAISGCSNMNKQAWLYAHIADQAEILDNSQLLIPVKKDIIAFTGNPYTKRADLSGDEFIALLDDYQMLRLKTFGKGAEAAVPRNAILSWQDGEVLREASLAITHANTANEEQAIVYTLAAPMDIEADVLKAVHLYFDSHRLLNAPTSGRVEYFEQQHIEHVREMISPSPPGTN